MSFTGNRKSSLLRTIHEPPRDKPSRVALRAGARAANPAERRLRYIPVMRKPIYWVAGVGLALTIIRLVWGTQDRVPQPIPAANEPNPSVVPAQARAGEVAARPAAMAAPEKLANTTNDSLPSPVAESALPIDVTPGFELLATRTSSLKDTDPRKPLLLRHEELQAEPRDPAWSPQMEATLLKGFQDLLTEAGVDIHRVELPVVECRRSGCEIQAIGFREDVKDKNTNIQLIVARMLAGPLRSELESPFGTMSKLPDGRVGYIVLLNRRNQ